MDYKDLAPAVHVIKRRVPFLRGNTGARFVFDTAFSKLFSVARLPLANRVIPYFRQNQTDLRCLPIAENIELPEGTPLPVNLLFRFIEEASHRTITEGGCLCRISCGCKNYPEDIGCLFLGDSSIEISDTINRELTVEEAKDHAGRAIAAGLVPMIGKVRFDNIIYMVRDRSRLLTVCFCCECCCVSRHLKQMKVEDFKEVYPRLDGVVVEVTDACTGCGKCADQCFVKAIDVSSGTAVISDLCRACGRCASVCPKDAIAIRIEDQGYIDLAYERIRSYVKHD